MVAWKDDTIDIVWKCNCAYYGHMNDVKRCIIQFAGQPWECMI